MVVVVGRIIGNCCEVCFRTFYSVLLCSQSESGDVRCYCVEADHIGDFSVRRSEGFLLPLQ